MIGIIVLQEMKSVFDVGYKIIQKKKIAVYGASGFRRKKAQNTQNDPQITQITRINGRKKAQETQEG